MKLPIDVRDVLRSGAAFQEQRARMVRIAVFVDVDAPDALVDAVREALRPQTSGARLHIEACAPGEALIVDPAADAVIALAGPSATLMRSLVSATSRHIPVVALASEGAREDVAERLGLPVLDAIVSDDPAHAVRSLGTWLSDQLAEKRIALAANFPFVRRAAAEEAIRATAFQNGVIGGVVFIPGADMPIMTANQAKMLLQIAAAYGQSLSADRVKELAAVVGGGFLFRSIARQMVGVVPVVGWAVKAGVGYSGTLAMGYAALEYFERGGDVSGLAETARAARDRALASARSLRSRRRASHAALPAEKDAS